MTDNFRGDNANLISSILALLELDAEGALVPHGVGGHARTLLSAAASRLAAGASEGQAPVAIYHGNGIVDCGDSGHHNIELLKMIPAGAKLYKDPSGEIAALRLKVESAEKLADHYHEKNITLRERIAGMEKDAEQRHDKIRQIVCDWFDTSSYLKYALTDIDAAIAKEPK